MKIILQFLVFYFSLNFVDLKIVIERYTVADATRFERDLDNDYIYACGDEFMETKCKCNNTILNCDLNDIKNLNIHIIAENFTVKSAQFKKNGITVLKKKQILPGREYSILKLDFSHNFISTLDSGIFDGFKKLEELILYNNILTKIDENVLTESLGRTLIHLDLKDNKLEQITTMTFKYMFKLESLNLSNNAALMPFFNKKLFSTSLANLKVLDLSWCNISTLDDDTFVNLLNLKNIQFHMNPITTVPTALKYLPNLETLDLSHTDLKSLSNDDFGFNPKLKYLGFIAVKKMTIINDCAFCNFPNLEIVTFCWSPNISFFHENAFGSISSGKAYSNIKEFNIEYTIISTISERLFDWSKANKLYLRTKEYTCDCSMAWLINDLQSPDSIYAPKLHNYLAKKYVCKNDNTSVIDESVCGERTKKNSNKITVFDYIFWMLLFGVVFGIVVFCCIYRNKIVQFVYRLNLFNTDGTDKLFHYRNLEEEDCIYHNIVEDSVSV